MVCVRVCGYLSRFLCLQQARTQHAAAVACGSLLYLSGGLSHAQGPRVLDSVDAFSRASNTWKAAASFHTPRFGHASASSSQGLYVFGGWTDVDTYALTDSVERYDCAQLAWSPGPNLPHALSGLSVASVPATSLWGAPGILLAGGFVAQNSASHDVWFFDGTSYRPALPMLSGRAEGSLVLCSWSPDAMWLYSLNGAADNAPALNTVERCDITRGCVWTRVSMTAYARDLGAGGAVGDLVFTLGGRTPEMQVLSSVEVLNTSDGSQALWTTLADSALPGNRVGLSVVALGASLIACGGDQGYGSSAAQSTWELSLPS